MTQKKIIFFRKRNSRAQRGGKFPLRPKFPVDQFPRRGKILRNTSQSKGAAMANTYLVDVDLAQLRAHRSRVENRHLSEEDVRSWLLNYGFYPRMDGLY